MTSAACIGSFVASDVLWLGFEVIDYMYAPVAMAISVCCARGGLVLRLVGLRVGPIPNLGHAIVTLELDEFC